MNRSKIEWCKFTCNPITGCRRLCRDALGRIYCYAYHMAKRHRGRDGYPQDDPFRPTLHFNMLTRPERVKKSTTVFLVSMGDIFDREVPDLWRYLVFNMPLYSPQHTFLVLTKQVERAAEYFEKHDVPENLWIGITQDGKTTTDGDIEYFRSLDHIPRKFVSFEPLLGKICANFYGLDWIIIGAQTGQGAKPPLQNWVYDILNEADSWDIPVFLKNNLRWHEKIQQFPNKRDLMHARKTACESSASRQEKKKLTDASISHPIQEVE